MAATEESEEAEQRDQRERLSDATWQAKRRKQLERLGIDPDTLDGENDG